MPFLIAKSIKARRIYKSVWVFPWALKIKESNRGSSRYLYIAKEFVFLGAFFTLFINIEVGEAKTDPQIPVNYLIVYLPEEATLSVSELISTYCTFFLAIVILPFFLFSALIFLYSISSSEDEETVMVIVFGKLSWYWGTNCLSRLLPTWSKTVYWAGFIFGYLKRFVINPLLSEFSWEIMFM
jgi:hypothetical protein